MRTKLIVVFATLAAMVAHYGTEAADENKIIEHPEGGKLVLLPSGEFEMGAVQGDPSAEPHEKPSFKARIRSPYLMGTREVTVGQYRRFVAATGYQTRGERVGSGGGGYDPDTKQLHYHAKFNWRSPGFEQTENDPVVCVCWDDAVAYCRWLTDKDGKRRFRLPTEAEWEYAARGGARKTYPHGDAEKSLILKENVADRSLFHVLSNARPLEQGMLQAAEAWNDRYSFTAPVGSFKPNAWGLYDMGGNADEWVEDYYDVDQYVRQDTRPPSSGRDRVHRGGCWLFSGVASRCSMRGHRPGTDAWCHLGFRIAADAD